MTTHACPGVPMDQLDIDVSADVEALYTDGITARKGAFTPEWADRLREDIEKAFAEAMARPDGAVGARSEPLLRRDPPRTAQGGFVDLVDHPWVRSLCTAVLGPDYRIVELGFDVPPGGAVNQPGTVTSPCPRRPGASAA